MTPDDHALDVIGIAFSAGHAPWTAEQVSALNEYQQSGWMHPYTCGNRDVVNHLMRGERDLGILIATTEGWVCRDCYYTQNWA